MIEVIRLQFSKGNYLLLVLFIDLLTVCIINQASAKAACDDFVTCPAALATTKEVAFGTQISTELKAP